MVKLRHFLYLVVGAILLVCMVIVLLETYADRGQIMSAEIQAYNEFLQETQERMVARTKRMKQVCSREKTAKRVSAEIALKTAWKMTEVIKNHRLMVCVVHKAGSSTWNTIAALLFNKEHLIKGQSTYKMIEELMPEWKNYILLTSSPSVLKVLMARNPFDRLLSGFLNRVVAPGLISAQAKRYVPLILHHNRGVRLPNEDIFHTNGSLKIFPTFSEFINYIVTVEPKEYDPHWKPVFIQCGVCHVDYDAVLLTETFSEDLQYILMISGLEKKVNSSLALQHVNKSHQDTHQLLASYYSTLKPEVLEKLIQIYQMDFDLFNYDPNVIYDFIFFNRTH